MTNYNAEFVQDFFDQTWWKRRINAGMVQRELKGRCVIHKGWNWIPFKKTRGCPNNSKRKTLRTHRNFRARK